MGVSIRGREARRMWWAGGQANLARLGQGRAVTRAHAAPTQGFSPERVDIDEARGVNGLVVALHVHAARREGYTELTGCGKWPWCCTQPIDPTQRDRLGLPLLSSLGGVSVDMSRDVQLPPTPGYVALKLLPGPCVPLLASPIHHFLRCLLPAAGDLAGAGRRRDKAEAINGPLPLLLKGTSTQGPGHRRPGGLIKSPTLNQPLVFMPSLGTKQSPGSG